MKLIETSKLSEGMIVCENVFSKNGQIIVSANSSLTRQMISHLKYYRIDTVTVIDNEEIPEETQVSLTKREKVENMHLSRLLSTLEYAKFKAQYTENVEALEHNFNDIIFKNTPIDEPTLITDTVKLFDDNPTTYSLFGMLHTMKQIDDSTYAHCVNVSIISRLIGTWMNMSEDDLDLLTLAGLLHDIGKCQIPSDILLKPGKLTRQEFEFIKKHPEFGYALLEHQDIDERIKQAVLLHHERYNGSGYPFGYSGEQLKEFESIISIADVYDAMTSARCYRGALCPFDVIATFEEEGLDKYNPKYIYTFLEKIANSYLNSDILLSNGEVARIIYVTKKLTRPVVQIEKDKSFFSLEDHLDVYIEAIV